MIEETAMEKISPVHINMRMDQNIQSDIVRMVGSHIMMKIRLRASIMILIILLIGVNTNRIGAMKPLMMTN